MRSYSTHIAPEYAFVDLSKSFGNSFDREAIESFYDKYRTCRNRTPDTNPALALIVKNNTTEYVVKTMSKCLTIFKAKPDHYDDPYKIMVNEILTEVLPSYLEEHDHTKNNYNEPIKSQKETILYFKLLTGIMIGSVSLAYLIQKTVQKYHSV